MESDLEAQLCFEFDNLKSYVVDWCVRVVRIVQQNSDVNRVVDGSQSRRQPDDHGSPLLQLQEPKLEEVVDQERFAVPTDACGNEEEADRGELPVSVSSEALCFDPDGGQSHLVGDDERSPGCSHDGGLSQQLQLRSSMDLSNSSMTEAARQQSNFITRAQLGTPDSGTRTPSCSSPMTSGLGNHGGGPNALDCVDPESREYARFLLNSQRMSSDAVNGCREQIANGELKRSKPADGLDAVINDISSGSGYNLEESDSEMNNSSSFNPPTNYLLNIQGDEPDSKRIAGMPLNTSPKKLNSTRNGKNGKVCDYCNRTFRDSYCVKRHIYSVHLDDKNFACELCPERFKSKQGLIGHMKKRHS